MKWSLHLGTYAGIGVYLHWTFALLIGWIFLVNLGSGQTVPQALAAVGFVLALFFCVVLHEFGHALTAKRYGVRTRDITLLPSAAWHGSSGSRKTLCRSFGLRWPVRP